MVRRVLFVCFVGMLASVATAGDLDPPAGPITPTDRERIHGPSATVPVTIDESGSYVLTGNLTGVAGEHGIVIAADGVTLDLNGFVLRGVTDSLAAIATDGARSAVTVTNGTIEGWGGDGISLRDADGVRISEVTAHNNGASGIAAGDGAMIERCTAYDNLDGMEISSGVVRDCIARGNTEGGVLAVTESTVLSCHATGNGANGIEAQSRSVLRENHTSSNGQSGVTVTGSFNTVLDNTSSMDGIGVRATSDSNSIFRNTVNFAFVDSYDISDSNTLGPIIDTSGGTIVSSAQPFANIAN